MNACWGSLLGMERPDIYSYFDYCLYLQDAQRHIKAGRRAFTLEFIAAQLGFKSKGHIALLFQGKKRIAEQLIPRIAELFGLAGDEADFLVALIRFGQARTHREKKGALDRMVALQVQAKRVLNTEQYVLCEQWYYPVIRELVRVVPIVEDWGRLASCVRPRISAKQAEQAVEKLIAARLIYHNEQGLLFPTDEVVTFGSQWRSVAVREFQMQALELAKQALEQVPPQEREISHLTLSVSRERFELIRSRMREFREELIELVRSGGEPEEVMQLELAFYPVSQVAAVRSQLAEVRE